ncbi:gp37 [Leucania separata nucleopolyhedrovirus]|uniref:Gp37 n=1 Tax=Leucania separata nucleopolyhedrovirus TaxID=1307956 RepID=Q0IL84_NPVLS|nr:gp37 [Leucania separata nucleopolyhedrovirus]AAR28799.1 gp37 [Leucania separata nucleopolyhedrovirus]
MVTFKTFANRFVSVACVFASLQQVASHGYLSYPVARQYRCYVDGEFWWPSNGDGIPDEACRDSYKSVYYKYRSNGSSEGEAANAAQYMFQQYQEYAALAGSNYEDVDHLRNEVVRSGRMCSADATNRSMAFGDKSGMDLPTSRWRTTTIGSPHQTIRFCATTVHEPSYFEVYVTDELFDVAHDKVAWDNVQNVPIESADLVDMSSRRDPYCDESHAYEIRVQLPLRMNPFVLFVRWQRIDVAGEGFYNCADVQYASTKDSSLSSSTTNERFECVEKCFVDQDRTVPAYRNDHDRTEL